MAARGRLVGFVGFERLEVEKTWTDEEIVQLTICGEILANALEHKRNRIDLLHARQELESARGRADRGVVDRERQPSPADCRTAPRGSRPSRATAIDGATHCARQRDRQLVAYEIHDAIVQDITAAPMHVEAYHDACRGAAESPQQGTHDAAMQRALTLLRSTIDESRRLISGLRPPIIDEMGVVAAIEYLVGEQPRGGATPVTFSHNVRFQPAPRRSWKAESSESFKKPWPTCSGTVRRRGRRFACGTKTTGSFSKFAIGASASIPSR